MYLVRMDKFEKFHCENLNSETAYLLGYLWADGWLCDSGKKRTVGMEITKADGNILHPLFMRSGPWNCSTRNRGYGKDLMSFSKHNKPLFSYLESLGYRDKKNRSFKLRHFAQKF